MKAIPLHKDMYNGAWSKALYGEHYEGHNASSP